MKERLHEEIKKLIALLVIGFLYLLFVLATGVRIPCIFNLVTGLQCPACGITRMLVSVSKLDFISAFHYNPVLFVTLPVILGCLINERITYIRKGYNKLNPFCSFFLWLETAILIIYGIIRNIG